MFVFFHRDLTSAEITDEPEKGNYITQIMIFFCIIMYNLQKQ